MEEKHKISEVMGITMEKIKEMIDVNTIIGQPIRTPDRITIIPVYKDSLAIESGGTDFDSKHQNGGKNPFGGGGGAGVNIAPVAFLIVNKDHVRLLPVAPPSGGVADRVVDMVPEIVDKVTGFFDKKNGNSDEDDEVF